MTPRLLLSTTLVAVSFLSGCASAPKQAEVDANGKKIEYVYITPTGSNVPVKVRKDQAPTGDQQTADDQQALRKLLQQSSRPDKAPGGT